MQPLSLQSLQAVYDLAAGSEPLSRRILEALQVIEKALVSYGEAHVAISFNGGKDCTVLLHLYAAVLALRRSANAPLNEKPIRSNTVADAIPPIRSIYVTCMSPFQEVEDFVEESCGLYNLRMKRIGGGMKEALRQYIECEAGAGVEAVLVGTRRGDPHGAKLEYNKACDPGWPKLMRVHPIINWSYQDVWDFLRRLDVPYCSIYDEGYTSLGSTFNTFRNPALRDPSLPSGWKPAYELTDESLERAGRGLVDPSISAVAVPAPPPAANPAMQDRPVGGVELPCH